MTINPVQADNIIKNILIAPNETRAIEFKPSIPWPPKIDNFKRSHKVQEIIKSILGMSNIRDGGKIILGIEKDKASGNYVAKGMKAKDLQTYDSDLIYQQLRIFGSPEPRFQVLNVEYEGKYFVVFNIQDFLFSPVICVNNRKLKKLENIAIYTRTHKPESKRVTDQSEMREIINLSIEKELGSFSYRMGNLFKSMSKVHVPRTTDAEKFKRQRGNL